MIESNNQLFYLTTTHTSYWFRVTPYGHLEHVYYGPRVERQSMECFAMKQVVQWGTTVLYSKESDTYSLDTMCLEWSGMGRGDFRRSPMEIKMPDGSFVHDFRFKKAITKHGTAPMESLPTAYANKGDSMYLDILLEDESNQLELHLIYTVYESTDVITRRAVLVNRNEKTAVLRRMLSMMVDIPNRGYRMTTFDGSWIREAHRHDREVQYGITLNSSTTGNSSNQHNPGFLLSERNATEDQGWVYGFNLVYSSNHYGSVELNYNDIARVSIGINDHCFEWELHLNEQFESPEAVMTFSDEGLNGVSHHFHDFINAHIIRGDWKHKDRPILINNWEADFFDFKQRKLIKSAEQAKKLGIELFVLDDGWFGARNNDKAGLGDYQVNRKKLPGGMAGLSKQVRAAGLMFGLWFEPEMVNEDSDLYRAHPEYAVTLPGKNATYGRNQLVLDLCKPEVQDYIVEQVSRILDEAQISYVKWDMNRHISEAYSAVLHNQGEFFHRYTIGLYRILKRIFEPRSHILLESCSSGGNRFDLGMLCYSPQIWCSDDTDPVERLTIQGGLSYLYPISVMGAHVSASPSQQTIRNTALSTRFNAAAFGCLGYELDLKCLTKAEQKEIAEQIAFYKEHRHTFQYGVFSRIDYPKDNKVQWQVCERDGSKAITGFFQTLTRAAEGYDYLRVTGLNPQKKYCMQTKSQHLYLDRFKGLDKHVMPVKLNPDGVIFRTANRHYTLQDGVEEYHGTGTVFASGVMLNNQFIGSGINEHVRVLGDFGSNLYVTKEEP